MKAITIFVYALLLISPAAIGQSKNKSFPSRERVTATMDQAMKKSDLPALVAIAVNTRNERASYAYGNAVWSESEKGKVTGQHIFRIWSMTKLVTSIAAMQLVEKGLIGLDDDLTVILPEMAKIPILSDGQLHNPKKPITLRHLLSHTAGFGYRGTDLELSKFDDSKWTYADLPRRFESGTKFLYGPSTYWAGKVVEKVTGTDLETYFRKNITGPLGMNRTWFNLPDSLKPYFVSRGTRGDDGNQPLTESPDRTKQRVVTDYRGDGGLVSSPDDFTLLLKCLLNYGTLNHVTLLKKQTILEMIKNQLGDVSLRETALGYFDPGSCCNFNGLIAPSSTWGLAWLIDNEDKPYGPKAGTVSWGGAYNTFFYIDFKSGVAASIYTQHIPFNHPLTIDLFHKFSALIYGVEKVE